jgi:orotidine-5'-phosphate decarboxylase
VSNVSSKIILALDGVSLSYAIRIVEEVGRRVYAVKVHDLADQEGVSRLVRLLKKAGAPRVWVDYKLHDIPTTVGLRVKSLVSSGADIISVHASGSVEMMRAAKKEAGGAEIFAVTALTSLSGAEMEKIYSTDPRLLVLRWARLACEAGVHGIVCSPLEVSVLHAKTRSKAVAVGVRGCGQAEHDQARTDTPYAAIRSGADHVVIGRMVTGATHPLDAFSKLEEEIALALGV